MLKFKKITAILLAVALMLGAMPLSLMVSAAADVVVADAVVRGDYTDGGLWYFNKVDNYYFIEDARSGCNLAVVDEKIVLAEKNPDSEVQRWSMQNWYGGGLTIWNQATGIGFNQSMATASQTMIGGQGHVIGVWAEGAMDTMLKDPSEIVEDTKYIIGNKDYAGNYLCSDAPVPEVVVADAVVKGDYTDGGLWYFNKVDDYYFIEDVRSGYYLAVVDGKIVLAEKNLDSELLRWSMQNWYGGGLTIWNQATGIGFNQSMATATQTMIGGQGHVIGVWAEGTMDTMLKDPSEIVEGTKYIIGNKDYAGNYLCSDAPVPEVTLAVVADAVVKGDYTDGGLWYFKKVDNYYFIEDARTGYCLAVVGGKIVIAEKNLNSELQHWSMQNWYGGGLTIWNQTTGIGFNQSMATATQTMIGGQGHVIGVWAEGAMDTMLKAPSEIVEGTKYIIGNKDYAGNYLCSDYSEIIYRDCGYGSYEDAADYNGYWIFEDQGDGVVSVKNDTTGKYLAAVDGDVCLLNHNANDSRQLWNFLEYNNMVNLQNKATNQFLSVTQNDGGTLSGGIPIGIWPANTDPSWEINGSYTSNGIRSVSEMVYGNKYIIGNSNYMSNYIGAVAPAINLNGVAPIDGVINIFVDNIVIFNASYEEAPNKSVTVKVVSGKENVAIALNDDGSISIYGKALGEGKILIASIEDPNVYIEFAVNVSGAVGDVNNDGEIDILDLIAAKKYLLGHGTKNNFDFNDDGKINATDMVALIKVLFDGGSEASTSTNGTPLKKSYVVPKNAITGNYEVGTTTEISLTSKVEYANPYTMVAVNALFEGPGGIKRTVPAFWDGGKSWKIRFSPDFEGEWKFTTSCTDEKNTGLHNCTGSFTAKEYTGDSAIEKHGRLRLSDDKETLTYGDGTPFFWLADTSWYGLSNRQRWDDSNYIKYESMHKGIIDARAEQGYTAYQITFYLNSLSDLRNEGGAALNGTFEEVNPEYFKYSDYKIQYCVEKGIVPVIGFGWGGLLNEANYEEMERVARYIIARYSSYPVVWMMFGEFQSGTNEYLCGRLGQYMCENDPFDNLITIHGPAWVFSETINEYPGDYFRGQAWYDFIMSEGCHHKNWDYKENGFQFLDDWKFYDEDPYKLPWLEAEAKYEDIWEIPSGQTREVAYLAVMNGSLGYSYGAEGLWQASWNSDDGFQTYGRNPTAWFNALTKDVGSKHMTYFYNFFTSVPWWKLDHDTETVEFTYRYNPPTTVLQPTVSTDANKDWMLIYYPMESLAVNNMVLGEYTAKAKGLDPNATYRAYWYNTTTGKQIAISNNIKVNADGTYQLPIYENIKKNDVMFVMKKNGTASLREELKNYSNSQNISFEIVRGEKALPAIGEQSEDNIQGVNGTIINSGISPITNGTVKAGSLNNISDGNVNNACTLEPQKKNPVYEKYENVGDKISTYLIYDLENTFHLNRILMMMGNVTAEDVYEFTIDVSYDGEVYTRALSSDSFKNYGASICGELDVIARYVKVTFFGLSGKKFPVVTLKELSIYGESYESLIQSISVNGKNIINFNEIKHNYSASYNATSGKIAEVSAKAVNGADIIIQQSSSKNGVATIMLTKDGHTETYTVLLIPSEKTVDDYNNYYDFTEYK